jgi:hypothetical protein
MALNCLLLVHRYTIQYTQAYASQKKNQET